MARRLRVHIPGGCYHVTLRGNHRQDLFRDAADRSTLDAIVRGASERTQTRVLAYCWMSNHIHLVVQVGGQPLGKLMQLVGSKYARYLQRNISTTGHLFERRYHAVLVTGEHQLLHVVRYVHFNPVRAGLAALPGAYPWSSHRQYLGRRHSTWVYPALVLGYLAMEPAQARRAFAAFCGEALVAPDCMEVARRALAVPAEAVRPAAAAMPLPGMTLDQIVAEICRQNEISEQRLAAPGKSHWLSALRGEIAARATSAGTSSLTDVARRFNRDISSLGRAAARWQQMQRKLQDVKPGTSGSLT